MPPNAIFGEKKLMKRPYETVLRENYRTCVYRWRQLLVSSQTRVEENLISADNVGALYRYVNRRITSNSSVRLIVDHSGAHNVLIAISTLCAFNNYFAAVGTSDNNITTCDTALLKI